MSGMTGYDQAASYPTHQYYEPGQQGAWSNYHTHHHQQPVHGDNSPTQRYPAYYDNR